MRPSAAEAAEASRRRVASSDNRVWFGGCSCGNHPIAQVKIMTSIRLLDFMCSSGRGKMTGLKVYLIVYLTV